MPDVPQDLNRPPPAPGPDPLAASLANLEPAPAALDRDRLMFAAGAASQRPVVRLWMLTAGFLAAMGFAAGMYVRPPAVVYVDRVPPSAGSPVAPAVTEMPPADPPAPRPDERASPDPHWLGRMQPGDPDAARWLRVRNDVLAAGLGVLPDPGRAARTTDRPAVPNEFYAVPPPRPTPPKKDEPRDDDPE